MVGRKSLAPRKSLRAVMLFASRILVVRDFGQREFVSLGVGDPGFVLEPEVPVDLCVSIRNHHYSFYLYLLERQGCLISLLR